METCSCTGKPTLNDPILAFGIRECGFEGCRSDTDVIYTWASEPKCDTVSKCEEAVVKKLLEEIEFFGEKACKGTRERDKKATIYVIGFDIKSFDIPLISYRLWYRFYRNVEDVEGVRRAFEILFEFRGKVNDCEYSVVFLDFMDFVKSVVFPKQRINFDVVEKALNTCFETPINDSNAEEKRNELSFSNICSEKKLCIEDAKLNDELKKLLDDGVKERLKHDLNRLSIVFRFLMEIRGDNKALRCFVSSLRELLRSR